MSSSFDLRKAVEDAVKSAPILDLHTHLFAPQLPGMNLFGIDELLTYHYLVAEVLRFEKISPEQFFELAKPAQADLIWNALFIARTPLSEATSGVVSVLTAFGLDPRARNLDDARRFFAERDARLHVDEVLRMAGVNALVMTNDPLDPVERRGWDANPDIDPRFVAALRIDPVLNDWVGGCARLESEGYAVQPKLDAKGISEVRRYLDQWIARLRPAYVAVSLPDTFEYPHESDRDRLLRGAVLPACRDHGLPFAMMIGVRRKVNARLQGAGDGVGVADLSAIERMAEDHPANRFLVTTLAKENAHGLCVSARKFSNILPFGCWWFMNNPSIVEDTTLMRLEMLGPSFVPQHSDARVLDQLVYKWQHARRAIAGALTTRYEALEASGLSVSDDDISQDAKALMGGIAAEWLGLKW